MIIKYLYKAVMRTRGLHAWIEKRPYGCVVALSPDNIGASFVDDEDPFVKSEARRIAASRAKENYIPPVSGKVLTMFGPAKKRDEVNWAIDFVQDRAYEQVVLDRIDNRLELTDLDPTLEEVAASISG